MDLVSGCIGFFAGIFVGVIVLFGKIDHNLKNRKVEEVDLDTVRNHLAEEISDLKKRLERPMLEMSKDFYLGKLEQAEEILQLVQNAEGKNKE